VDTFLDTWNLQLGTSAALAAAGPLSPSLSLSPVVSKPALSRVEGVEPPSFGYRVPVPALSLPKGSFLLELRNFGRLAAQSPFTSFRPSGYATWGSAASGFCLLARRVVSLGKSVGDHPTANGDRLASRRVSPLLALEIAWRRKAANRSRAYPIDLPSVASQPYMGESPHPR